MSTAREVVTPAGPFARWAERGFGGELVRVEPGGKKPTEPEWQALTVTPKLLAAWDRSGANAGLRTGRYPTIDVDVDNPTVAAVIRDKVIALLGATPERRRANSPRFALVYLRDGEPFTKRKLEFRLPDGSPAKVEILADGQQVVVEGHHPSGAILEWRPEPPVAADLPLLSEAAADKLLADLRPVLLGLGCTLPNSAARKSAPSERTPRPFIDDNEERAREALFFLNTADDYDRWVEIGQALNDEWPAEGEIGFALWDLWSQGSPKYPGRDALEAKWRSFKPGGGITLATLFHRARAAGWQPPKSKYHHRASNPSAPSEALGNERPGLDLGKRWVTFSTADLTTDPPLKEFLWAGTIPAGDVGVFAAKGGAGKTALLTGLAIHRALGRPFLGRAVKQGSTTIVTAEDGRDDYLRKLAAWRSWIPDLALEPNRAAIARHLHLVDLVGVPFKLITSRYGEYLATAHVEMLAAAIAGRAPETDLIIIETVSRVGGDEGNAAMSALVCAAEELARLTGAAVLLVAHVSQDAARRNIGDAYAPRGGTAIGANGRYTMTLTGLTDEAIGELLPGVVLSPQQQRELSVFRVPKINAAPEPEPVVLQIVPTRWGLVLREYEVGLAQDPQERQRGLRRTLGEGLLALATRMTAVGHPLTASKLSHGLYRDVRGLAKHRIDSAIADAIEDGFLRQETRVGRGGGVALVPGTVPGELVGQIS